MRKRWHSAARRRPRLPVSCQQIKGSNQENTGKPSYSPWRKSFIAVLSNPGQQCSIFLTGSLVVSNGFKGQTCWAPTPLYWWNNSVSKCSLTPVRGNKTEVFRSHTWLVDVYVVFFLSSSYQGRWKGRQGPRSAYRPCTHTQSKLFAQCKPSDYQTVLRASLTKQPTLASCPRACFVDGVAD